MQYHVIDANNEHAFANAFLDASIYWDIPPESSGTRSWYQRNNRLQRLILMIPASTREWIDTHLQPRVLGTRPCYCMWRTRILYDPAAETQIQFAQRVSDIRVRFVRDPSLVEAGRRLYAHGADETPILSPLVEATLKPEETTAIRFPAEHGLIQVRLAGANQTDVGNTRVVFAAYVVDEADFFIYGQSVGRLDIFETTRYLEDLPDLPPMPDTQL